MEYIFGYSFSGFRNANLNGEYRQQSDVRLSVASRHTYWSWDATHFMYWQAYPNRFAMCARSADDGRDALERVQQGELLGCAFYGSSGWMEYLDGDFHLAAVQCWALHPAACPAQGVGPQVMSLQAPTHPGSQHGERVSTSPTHPEETLAMTVASLRTVLDGANCEHNLLNGLDAVRALGATRNTFAMFKQHHVGKIVAGLANGCPYPVVRARAQELCKSWSAAVTAAKAEGLCAQGEASAPASTTEGHTPATCSRRPTEATATQREDHAHVLAAFDVQDDKRVSMDRLMAEVQEWKRALEAEVPSEASQLTALRALKSLGGLPLVVLCKTSIGKTVTRCSLKSPYGEARALALELVGRWRKAFRAAKGRHGRCPQRLRKLARHRAKAAVQRRPKKRKGEAQQAIKFSLCLKPFHTGSYVVGEAPPQLALHFFLGFINARETVAKRRALGLVGPKVYDHLPPEYAGLLRAKVCPNIRRNKDRTTRRLHQFAAAVVRHQLCTTDEEREHLKRLFVLNFALWRLIGGTFEFARAIGFLTNWGPAERKRVLDVVQHAFDRGIIKELFSAAYQCTSAIRNLLGPRADPDRVQAVLFNRGPKAETSAIGIAYLTLEGKLKMVDMIWEVASDVVKASLPDPESGKIAWRPVTNVLGRVLCFGTTERGKRLPTFFAKEVAQDLLDTPVFAGGRSSVSDLKSFCPAGPGALRGLQRLYGLRHLPTQGQAIPMMRALLQVLEGPQGWAHQDTGPLELHDVQFMLCEIHKFRRGGKLRNYTGRQDHFFQDGFLSTTWVGLLEDAILLSDVAVGQGGGRSDVEVLENVVDWFRLPPWVQFAELPLSHGDQVVLRVASTGDLLHIDEQGMFKAIHADPRPRSATFLLERSVSAGAIYFGETIFLRSVEGAHLIVHLQKQHFCAPTSSGRYETAAQFSFRPGNGDEKCTGLLVSNKAVVRLRHCDCRGSGHLQVHGHSVGLEPNPAAGVTCILSSW